MQKPRPGPSQAGARPEPSATAWLELPESRSPLGPGQSRGFWAKPGRAQHYPMLTNLNSNTPLQVEGAQHALLESWKCQKATLSSSSTAACLSPFMYFQLGSAALLTYMPIFFLSISQSYGPHHLPQGCGCTCYLTKKHP